MVWTVIDEGTGPATPTIRMTNRCRDHMVADWVILLISTQAVPNLHPDDTVVPRYYLDSYRWNQHDCTGCSLLLT
ncbi:hypothetical protein YTPLAS72_20860 [Nitrospira sp.]|nr:hypothetical protein YTPLAS72_20860 [Nitrospira sp.]